MKYPSLLFFAGLLFSLTVHAQVTIGRIDSTLKIGKAGYKVNCRNKDLTQNQLSIRPIGFESTAREINFTLKGRVSNAQIDDLNQDGFPDLVLFIYTDSNAVNGTVYCFSSDGNKEIIPSMLPDVVLDSKINKGYRGHDHFSLLEGTLLQKFPVYNSGDDNDKPTGGTRVIQYHLVKGENGATKFSILRFYDTK
ncbi:MAG TPA: hypothetical protein VHD83_22845 [Puia sp.]|nr:hypothetical protein [Puia sp.]